MVGKAQRGEITMFEVSGDVIDSRDIIERLETLQEERDALEAEVDETVEAINDWEEPEEPNATTDKEFDLLTQAKDSAVFNLKEWDKDFGEELKALNDLEEDASQYASDWRHGESLIADDHFVEWCQDFASDIGAYDNRKSKWPTNCIDWDKAASELQYDYTEVYYNGNKYWIRNS
jgi:hypothetical protein